MEEEMKAVKDFLKISILLVVLFGITIPVTVTAQSGSTELVAINREPATVDPHVGNDAGVWRVIVNTYEPLVGYKRGTNELEGVLAESWDISEDGLTYTFKLREGVTFHDGTPFNADAVKVSFDRIKTINLGPAYILSEYRETEVIDEFTVAVHLNNPVATFLASLPRIFIVSPTAIAEHEVDGDLAQEWLRENTVGTGPYMLDHWSPGEEWEIVKYDDYWQGWPENHLTSITLLFVSEVSTARLMLEQGDVDIVGPYSTDDLPALEANPDINVYSTPTALEFYIPMNTAEGPLTDPLVREAVTLAFDYEAYVEVMGGRTNRVNGSVPYGIPMHDADLPLPEYNLDRARELLTEAGYPDGGFKLEYGFVNVLLSEQRAGEILQAGLAQLGVELEIQPMAWPTLLSFIQAPADEALDLYAFYIYPAYPDPDAYLYTQFHSSQIGASYNGMFLENARIDELLDAGKVETDPEERAAIYAELQQLISNEYVCIFVGNDSYNLPMRSWVKDFKYTPAFNETYFFYGVYLEGKPS
jgi:peptide/nickel transport system substrate-binding protein